MVRVHRPAGSVRATLRGRGGPVLVSEVGVYRPESRRRPVPASGQRCSRAVAGDRAGPKPGAGGVVSYPALTPDAVSWVLRGRGRTSGVPVSGSEGTCVAGPRTSPACQGGIGSFPGGLC